MPGLSRQQLIAWAAVGLIILLIGANYLRGQLSVPSAAEDLPPVTMSLKENRPEARLKVHVVGAVVRPGLYEVEAGSRVADALDKAGGPTPAADLNQVNLAAKMADGQQLVVPEKGAAGGAAAGGTGVADGGGGNGGGAAGAGMAGQPVNLNTATLEQIDGLDGIGPKTAQKIIDYREAHGGFKSIEELMEVPGIGPAKFEQLKADVVI